MWPGRVSNPGPAALESDALVTAPHNCLPLKKKGWGRGERDMAV